MLHPVLPPAPPPIIESVKSASSPSLVSSTQIDSFVNTVSNSPQNISEKLKSAEITVEPQNVPKHPKSADVAVRKNNSQNILEKPKSIDVAVRKNNSQNILEKPKSIDVAIETQNTPEKPKSADVAVRKNNSQNILEKLRNADVAVEPQNISEKPKSAEVVAIESQNITEKPKSADVTVRKNVSPQLVPISKAPENLVTTKTLSTPTTPETLPSALSPFSISTNATNLGEPLAVGYVVQSLKVSSENVTPADSTNQRSRSPNQIVAEKLPQPESQQPETINLSGTFTDHVPSTQPVKNIIEFKSRSLANESATPASIEFKAPTQPTQPTPAPTTNPQQSSPTTTPVVRERIVEVVSDRQEYDEQRRVVTAEGNVVVRFDGAVVDADRLQVNLANLIAVGEGNVVLTRGDQILRGQRFTYNFLQDSGDLENGSGEIYIPSASTDLAFLPNEVTTGTVPQRPPSDRIRANQPLTNVQGAGGVNVVVGGRDASNLPRSQQGGEVKRLRFEARYIDFYPRGWQARDVRITNDPFSPPELELRANKVTLTRQAPLVDRIKTEGQRLVFDQGLSLPIPIDNQTIDRREREVSPIVSFGYDGEDRGGLYLERSFTPINTETARLTITPQFFIQRAGQEGLENPASVFGFTGRGNLILGPKTTLRGSGELTSFDLSQVDDNLRASLRLQQEVGAERNPHIVNVEYSYRDRLYNGSLGFQTVQSSLGAIVTSPYIPLGKSGIYLDYQAGAQYINANSDRQDLLEPDRSTNRISLGRLQASAGLSTGIYLWQGKPLPATATQGLRYTPNPVVPYLQATANVRATTSYYTSGDDQSTLIGTVGLIGQIGHFSRPFLDYTAFNISYSQGLNTGLSPFLFDRSVDIRVLSAGITQQIYGPFRVGFQTSINLDTGRETSTDYILEYNRRTYGITLRYNPVLELGGFSIRISDFNWTGGTDPFSNNQVTPVNRGVRQE